MKKSLSVFLTFLLVATILSSCGTTPADTNAPDITSPEHSTSAQPSETPEETQPSVITPGPSASGTQEPTTTAGPPAKTETVYPFTIEDLYFNPVQSTIMTIAQTYEKTPERVIVFEQAMIDYMVYFGLEEKIIGVFGAADTTSKTQLPEEYWDTLNSLNVISTDRPNIESVIELEPDLIIGYNPSLLRDCGFEDEKEVNSYGADIFCLRMLDDGEAYDIDYWKQYLVDFGILFDIQDEVNAFVEEQLESISWLVEKASALSDSERFDVMFLAVSSFNGGTYMCYNNTRSTPSFIELLGGKIITPGVGAGQYFGQVSIEQILEFDPPLIIYQLALEATDDWYNAPEFSSLTTVRNETIFRAPIFAPFQQPNVLFLASIIYGLAEGMHPDWF